MPKKAKDLTALEVKRLNKPGRHAVGTVSGLLLVIKDTGTKSWMLRTMIAERRANMGLGPYPEVTLAKAHGKARDLKEIIRDGIDPIAERRARKNALKRDNLENFISITRNNPRNS